MDKLLLGYMVDAFPTAILIENSVISGKWEGEIPKEFLDKIKQSYESLIVPKLQKSAQHDENHSLTASSKNQVGLLTEPSVIMQQFVEKIQNIHLHTARYLQIDNFLSQEQNQQIVNYALQQQPAFVPTTTSTGAEDYRLSQVLFSFPEFSQLIENRIQEIIPDVLSKLELPSFRISQIESQLTAHNDGNYYKIHNDNSTPDTNSRVLTYVYYFYKQPKTFSGGELRLYDSKIDDHPWVASDSFQTVEPRNNSIVFFLSRYLHEVLPVSCPSQAFADSRFTINGWIRW